MKQLVDMDPLSKEQTWFHYDPVTDETTVETVQDVEPFLEGNKTLLNNPDYKRQGIKDEMLHVARIPNAIIEKWAKEEGINVFNRAHWPAVRRKLMDPDYRYLRVTGGGL